MNKARKIMWVPMVMSAVALAAGMAGVVITGDLKLLLAVSVNMGFTYVLMALGVGQALKSGSVLAGHPKAAGWLDAFTKAFVISAALQVPMGLISRFSAFGDEWRWVKICLYAGIAIMPWGYCWTNAVERYRGWVAFVSVAVIVVALVFCWGPRVAEVATLVCLVQIAAVLAGHWAANRKEVRA